MPAAFTTTMLAWGILAFPTAYSQANEMQHATDSLRWGTDYLLKLYTPASSSNTTKTAHQYQVIYQVTASPQLFLVPWFMSQYDAAGWPAAKQRQAAL